MHVHHHHGFLPKDHVRQLVLEAGSPPARRITIPGLVKAIFLYPSLEYSLCVFFWQPLPHKEILLLPKKYCLTRTGRVFFRQTDSWAHCRSSLCHSRPVDTVAVTVQAFLSLQHPPHRADWQQGLWEAVSMWLVWNTSCMELLWRSHRARDTPKVYWWSNEGPFTSLSP